MAEKDGLSIDTLALIELTEKIVENNNTVSGAMSLMSENMEEVADSNARMEDKLDDHIEEITAMADVAKQIKNSGILSFLKFLKLTAYTALVTVTAMIIIAGVKICMKVWTLLPQVP